MPTTTLSSKGQIVVPSLIRRQLHLETGMEFFCRVEGDSVVLTPRKPKVTKRSYKIDPATGLRVRRARRNASPVTSAMIQALLEDYP